MILSNILRYISILFLLPILLNGDPLKISISQEYKTVNFQWDLFAAPIFSQIYAKNFIFLSGVNLGYKEFEVEVKFLIKNISDKNWDKDLFYSDLLGHTSGDYDLKTNEFNIKYKIFDYLKLDFLYQYYNYYHFGGLEDKLKNVFFENTEWLKQTVNIYNIGINLQYKIIFDPLIIITSLNSYINYSTLGDMHYQRPGFPYIKYKFFGIQEKINLSINYPIYFFIFNLSGAFDYLYAESLNKTGRFSMTEKWIHENSTDQTLYPIYQVSSSLKIWSYGIQLNINYIF